MLVDSVTGIRFPPMVVDGEDEARSSCHSVNPDEDGLTSCALPHTSHRQIPRAAVHRPRVSVSACRRHAGMAERGLHERDRRTSVERVAGVSVSKPVRRDVGGDTRALGGRLDNPEHLSASEVAASGGSSAPTMLGAEHRRVGGRRDSVPPCRASERDELAEDRRRKDNRPRL